MCKLFWGVAVSHHTHGDVFKQGQFSNQHPLHHSAVPPWHIQLICGCRISTFPDYKHANVPSRPFDARGSTLDAPFHLDKKQCSYNGESCKQAPVPTTASTLPQEDFVSRQSIVLSCTLCRCFKLKVKFWGFNAPKLHLDYEARRS